jgi:type IV pilus assembly protein PilA
MNFLAAPGSGRRRAATAAQGCPGAADLHRENRTDGFDKEESLVLQLMRRRLQGEHREGGFTLIELMVVVLIIAILIAIAIPTFLGARQRAQNRAAQSSLRNALTAAKTIYTDSQTYASATAAAMTTVEPSLDFVVGTATSPNQNTVSVHSSAAGVFSAAAMSASGTCYYIKENVASGTTYGSTTTAADCTGEKADGATAAAWT